MKNERLQKEDCIECYVGIHEIPTKELRRITNQSKTTSRQTCIRLLEDEDIHHLATFVHKDETQRIKLLWDRFKEFMTINETIHRTTNNNRETNPNKRIGRNVYREHTRNLEIPSTTSMLRSRPSLVLSDMSSSNMYLNHLRIGKDLLLNGRPILKVIDDTNNNIETMKTTIDSNQSIVDHVNSQVSYYESTVTNNMYYMLNPSESDDILELVTPSTFSIAPFIFKRTFIEDNVVTFSIRIVYVFDVPAIPPKIFRVKLPYVALQVDRVNQNKTFIPIRGIIKYTRNNKSYVSNPAQTYINLKVSDEHLLFQHTVQTLLSQIEFHILARYATDIDLMNISYITPMRYDMTNKKILTTSNITLFEGFMMQYGYMQWNLLKDRIELSLQLRLHMNPNGDHTEKRFLVQLPIHADVHYRSVNPFGYGSISINDQFVVERPVIWIDSTEQLTIDLSSVQSLFIVSESAIIDMYVNIVYFTFTSRYVRRPMMVAMHVSHTDDYMVWSDIYLSNAVEYVDQSSHLLNNYDMFVQVDIERLIIQQRSMPVISKYVQQTWVPIQEMEHDMKLQRDIAYVSKVKYYDAICIQTNRRKMTMAYDLKFRTSLLPIVADHVVVLKRLRTPRMHMKATYDEHAPYVFTISFTVQDVQKYKDGVYSYIHHDKYRMTQIKLLKCNKRYINNTICPPQPSLGIH